MSDIKLTCAETPLAWPASIAVSDLKTCSTCGIRLQAPQPGALQILTRRQGAGVGDGVNIDESITVGADYRGQRYSLEEAVFHTPGLHVFPGRTEVYPAEYQVHMRTMSAPIRYLTLVIPVSHIAADIAIDGSAYFAAAAAQPDPSVVRPTLDTLVSAKGIQMIQYQGQDLRGRTADVSPDDICNAAGIERQFLMVLSVAGIRATDLERIPREGSLSTDPRDLPAPGIAPQAVVPRDRLLRVAVLANPGILNSGPSPVPTDPSGSEMECKPVKVVNGRDIIDVSGQAVDIMTLLGISGETVNPVDLPGTGLLAYTKHATMFIGTMLGLVFADLIIGSLWPFFFHESNRLNQWEPIKIFIFLGLALGTAGFTGEIIDALGL